MDSSTSYFLSIRCFSDGFSFSVEQGKHHILTSDKRLQQGDLCAVLETELDAQHLMDVSFQQVKFVFYTPVFTLVPASLYREQDADVWLRLFREKLSLSQTICVDHLEKFGCKNLYEVPLPLLGVIKKRFPDAQVAHHITELLLKPAAHRTSSAVLADVDGGRLSLAVLVNGKLQMANTFSVKTAEDMAYWVLNMYEQFSLDQDSVSCYWYAKSGQEAKHILSQYIKIEN